MILIMTHLLCDGLRVNIFMNVLSKLDTLLSSLLEDSDMDEILNDKVYSLSINSIIGYSLSPMLNYLLLSRTDSDYAIFNRTLTFIGICSHLLPGDMICSDDCIDSEPLRSECEYAMQALNKAIQCNNTSPIVALIHELTAHWSCINTTDLSYK